MARMFRCVNPDCLPEGGKPENGFEFLAETPTADCPKCAGQTLALLPVHFLVKDKDGKIKTGMGRRRIACRPDVAEIRGRLTGVAAAVTCPACKATKDYEAENTAVALADEHEIAIGTPLAGE